MNIDREALQSIAVFVCSLATLSNAIWNAIVHAEVRKVRRDMAALEMLRAMR